MRVGTHAAVALGRKRSQLRNESADLVEERFRLIAAHPGFQLGQMLRVGAHVRQWHLMRAERALDWLTIHHLRSRPPLGRAQHDGRPGWLSREAPRARLLLNG